MLPMVFHHFAMRLKNSRSNFCPSGSQQHPTFVIGTFFTAFIVAISI
jgi:hypothetical protein